MIRTCARTESSSEQSCSWVEIFSEETSADLRQLANCGDIDVFAQSNRFECKHIFCSPKGLNLVDPNRYRRVTTHTHKRLEKFARRNIESTFALYDLHNEARMLLWISIDQLFQMPHCNFGRTRAKIRIIKRHVINKNILNESLPICGGISNLAHRCRAPHKTICKCDDSRRTLGFLLANLQRIFIGHTTRIGHKAMTQAACATRLRGQNFGDLENVNIMLEMPLHTYIRESALESSLDHSMIRVPKHIHTNSIDHVPLHAAVSELHKRAISNASTNVWIHRGTAAQFVVALQPGSV